MKYFKQHPEKFWWLQSANSMLYILREFSGILIFTWAFWTSWFMLFPGFFKPQTHFFVHATGLAGALIHTLTWLTVMPKLYPGKLSPAVHVFLFLLLMVIFFGFSALILLLF